MTCGYCGHSQAPDPFTPLEHRHYWTCPQLPLNRGRTQSKDVGCRRGLAVVLGLLLLLWVTVLVALHG